MRRSQGRHLSPADPQLHGSPILSLCFPTQVILGAPVSRGPEDSGKVQEVARFLTLKSAMWLWGSVQYPTASLHLRCIRTDLPVDLGSCWKSPVTSKGWASLSTFANLGLKLHSN